MLLCVAAVCSSVVSPLCVCWGGGLRCWSVLCTSSFSISLGREMVALIVFLLSHVCLCLELWCLLIWFVIRNDITTLASYCSVN